MVIWPGNVLHCESITVIVSSDFDLEQLSLYRMLYRYGTDVHFRVTPMRHESGILRGLGELLKFILGNECC